MKYWMHPPELARAHESSKFDPIVEGSRHGLSRDQSLALWARTCAEASDATGRCDDARARQRFHDIAPRIHAGGGRLRPDVGRLTRVAVELDGADAVLPGWDELADRVTGRETRVAREARRRRPGEPLAAPELTWPTPTVGGAISGVTDESAGGSSPGWYPAGRRSTAPAVLRSAVPGAAVTPGAAAAVPTTGGFPLPEELRRRLERALGVDLSAVRLHVDSAAARSAEQLAANAFTVGHDIQFGAGKYDPTSSQGEKLIAHEVAHTVQHARNGAPTTSGHVSSPTDAHEMEADRFGEAFSAGRTSAVVTAAPAVVHRDDKDKDKDGDKDKQVRAQLAAAGYDPVSDADVKQLLERYPDGDIRIGSTNMIASTASNKTASARRIALPTVLSKSGVVTYLLPVGAGGRGTGRSILLVPQGAAPIMLDAGGLAGAASGALAELMKAGIGAPSQIRISHTDLDHINDATRVIDVSGMAKPSIVLTRQQVQSLAGMNALINSKIDVYAERCVLLDVTGDGVHVHKEVHGNLELVELRLVAAHRTPKGGSQPMIGAPAKNASSPVTVVRDLSSGATQFFVSDLSAKTVMEIANYFHPSAMADLLGNNLQVAELPHHGGKLARSEVADYVNMLRMLYRASNGKTTFFVQTSNEVLGSSFAVVKALKAAGLPVATLTNDMITAIKDHPIPVIKDGKLVMLGKDSSGQLKEIEAAAQQGQDTLMRARAAEVAVQQFRDEVAKQKADAAGNTSKGDFVGAFDQLDKQLEADDKLRAAAVERWFGSLGAGLAAAPDADSFDPGACKEALASIEHAPTMGDTAGSGLMGKTQRTLDQYRAMSTALGSYKNLAEQQAQAAVRGDLAEVLALRTLLVNARADAVKALTPKEIYESVAAAYASEVPEITHLEEASVQLAQTLAAASVNSSRPSASPGYEVPRGAPVPMTQAELERLVAEAHGSGMNPNFGGQGPGRPVAIGATRGFVAFLAIIEIANEMQGVVAGIQDSRRRSSILAAKTAIRDRTMLNWWLGHGAAPTIQLLDDDSPLPLDNNACWNVMHDVGVTPGDPAKYGDVELPEDMRVVVTDVPIAQQKVAASVVVSSATDLDAFHRDMSDKRYRMDVDGQTPFQRVGDEWGTLLWRDGAYTPVVFPEISSQLKQLMSDLLKQKQDELDDQGDRTAMGWSASRVGVWVHRQRDDATDDTNAVDVNPHFVTLSPPGVFAFTPANDDVVELVAADAQTFDQLRKYWWWDGELEVSMPGPYTRVIKQNTAGRAMVKKSDLTPIPLTKPQKDPPFGPGDFPTPNRPAGGGNDSPGVPV